MGQTPPPSYGKFHIFFFLFETFPLGTFSESSGKEDSTESKNQTKKKAANPPKLMKYNHFAQSALQICSDLSFTLCREFQLFLASTGAQGMKMLCVHLSVQDILFTRTLKMSSRQQASKTATQCQWQCTLGQNSCLEACQKIF